MSSQSIADTADRWREQVLEPKPASVMPLVQAMELTRRWEQRQMQNALAPGMLCREKEGLGMFEDKPVLLLIRTLDEKSRRDLIVMTVTLNRMPLQTPDCIIGRVHSDGVYCEWAHELARLEPIGSELVHAMHAANRT